ncbi:hypothetical protein LNP26_28710 [Klebsiella variicola subsp. variicola]|nr:hypothetical protein [Klebsiella variicola subsp. variicola]
MLKQCADDPELVEELLGLFAERLDAAIIALTHAIDTNDRETWRRTAHKLRGRRSPSAFNALPGCSSKWRAGRRRPARPCQMTCATRWPRQPQAATGGYHRGSQEVLRDR